MPNANKAKYTDRQKRQAEDIAAGYERQGMAEKEATALGWATVNEMYGVKKSGLGRSKRVNTVPARKSRRKSAATSAARSALARKTARHHARRAR